MSEIKLTYFNTAGRAEGTRLLLTYGNKPFQDIRLKKEEFMTLKSTFPFGQLPVLEMDGAMLCQSHTMERYVAKQVGLYPKDPLAAAKAEIVMDGCEDVIKESYDLMWVKDKTEKQKKLDVFFKEKTIPSIFKGLEKMMEDSTNEDHKKRKLNGDFFLGKISFADFTIYNTMQQLKKYFSEYATSLEEYKKLNRIVNTIGELPAIKAYEANKQDAF